MNIDRIRLKKGLLLWLLFAFGPTVAATPMQEISMGIQRAKPEKKSPVDFSAEYRVVSDLNKPERPRTFDHSIELGASGKIFGDYTASISSGFRYSTLDQNVIRATDKDSYFKWGDIGLTAMRSFNSEDKKQSLTTMVSSDILVSEESRYLGYRGVFGAQVVHNWSVWSKLSIKNTLSGGYFLNRYRYSPVGMGNSISPGSIMADGYYGYSIGPIVTLAKGLRLGATMSVRGTHYLDQSNLFSFSNSYSLTYTRNQWSLYGRYLNRGYAERGETNLWFVDRYRSLATLGFIYNF